VQGWNWEATIHPDDRARSVDHWRSTITSGKAAENELRVRRADGEYRWILGRFVPLRDVSGKIVRWYGVSTDIDDRKRAEQAVRKSERILREAETLGHTGSWEHDLVTGEIFDTEENKCLFFGSDRSKGARFEDYVDAVHPDDRAFVKERHTQLLAEGGPREIEFRVAWPDGGIHVLFGRATVVRDESGRPIRVYGTNLDITERKGAEEALRQREFDLAEAQRIARLGSWSFDITTDAVRWSEELYRIFEFDKTDFGGNYEAFLSRVNPDDRRRVLQVNAHARSSGEPFEVEYGITTGGGKLKHIREIGYARKNGGGAISGLFGTAQDITERKQTEQVLRLSADRLQHLSRRLLEVQEEERRHLARELHDEFGQLLATVTLYLHAAKNVAGEAARPPLEECVALLQRAGGQVRSLALELRPMMLETLGLEPTLRWLAEEHEQRTGVAVQVVGHLHGVSGDLAIACFRVAQEALTNVVRHAAARHVWIEVSQSDRVLELIVRDDGVGFDVASTLDQAAQRGRLGLSGMRERVEILGGTLAVDSSPGHGTRIRISFPLTLAGTEPAEPVG
jgi:signal transduction histidine kinase